MDVKLRKTLILIAVVIILILAIYFAWQYFYLNIPEAEIPE